MEGEDVPTLLIFDAPLFAIHLFHPAQPGIDGAHAEMFRALLLAVGGSSAVLWLFHWRGGLEAPPTVHGLEAPRPWKRRLPNTG